MKYQIVVDSSSDLSKDYLKDSDIGFDVVPLSILIGEKEFVDNEHLQVSEMLDTFYKANCKTSTACPSPQAFADTFDRAEHTFIVTITSQLSGCYNSAVVASKENKNVYVVDSKSVSGSMILIVDKLVELIHQGLEFEEIIKKIEEYRASCKLLFVLQNFDNLVANGRMSKIAGFVAKKLAIKAVSRATDEGVIQVISKVIGTNNAYKKLVELMPIYADDMEGRRVIISHCNNQNDAEQLRQMILDKYAVASVEIRDMRGLTSYYAMEKGIIVCF